MAVPLAPEKAPGLGTTWECSSEATKDPPSETAKEDATASVWEPSSALARVHGWAHEKGSVRARPRAAHSAHGKEGPLALASG